MIKKSVLIVTAQIAVLLVTCNTVIRTVCKLTKKEGALQYIKFNNRSTQPFDLPDEVLLPYYEAYQHFENKLYDTANRTCFKLNSGEAIIYDNERILHGRTKYGRLNERHLQGCYSDRDGLTSKIKVLERSIF